jgi:hypothetical protein
MVVLDMFLKKTSFCLEVGSWHFMCNWSKFTNVAFTVYMWFKQAFLTPHAKSEIDV